MKYKVPFTYRGGVGGGGREVQEEGDRCIVIVQLLSHVRLFVIP